MTKRKRLPHVLKPRLRVLRGKEIVLGPGKADLLHAIARTGELRRAASELDMSYMRAWTLLRMMNGSFREPVVRTIRGGAGHGSARLTKTGRTVLALYRLMERRSLAASGPAFRRLRRLLAD
jgi:molybdate transport system regulatory protein